MSELLNLDKVVKIANRDLKKYGLKGWRVVLITQELLLEELAQYNFGRKWIGSCYHEGKYIIFNFEKMLQLTEKRALKVIRHEITHAILGPRKGHGKAFRKLAKKIGGYTGTKIGVH